MSSWRANALIHHRGALPHVSPTNGQLDLNLAGMLMGARGAIPDGLPPVRSEPHFAAVSVRYRSRFTFQKTL